MSVASFAHFLIQVILHLFLNKIKSTNLLCLNYYELCPKLGFMMERMLINATQPEEIRVALVKDDYLYDLDIDCSSEIKKKGNIYKAIVTRREPSLDAVFVEYGAKRQGFLPLKELSNEYFNKNASKHIGGDIKLPITALIKENQELLIQIDKEERGNKGAALTTFITLAGCYLVLLTNNPNSGGISRRIEGDDRDELKETLNALTLPDSMGLIIRTAGVGKCIEELQADLDMLCNQWQAIKNSYNAQPAPCLIHQEGNVIIRSIRDNLRKSIGEIIIDDHVSYVKAKQYIEQVKPDFLPNLKLYNNNIPLFNYYQIESQIETAYQREVLLPSGGVVVIDRTEALISIDVNSARSTSGADIETTAFKTNLEAANEIARQLRLRDLGGLVVIDFIDMSTSKNQRDIENRLKEALKTDRARIQIGRISRFGLLEMSRQRLRLSLGENAQEVCPRCDGRGTVRNIQSQSLSIVRLIEEEALKEKTHEIQVQLPVDMATFIINEKRTYLLNIEKRHTVHILIIANPYMQSPQYNIVRAREDNKSKKPSYTLIQQQDLFFEHKDTNTPIDVPAVNVFDSAMSSKPKKNNFSIFIKQLWQTIFTHKKPIEIIDTNTTVANTSISDNFKKPHFNNKRRRKPMTTSNHFQKSHLNQQTMHRKPQHSSTTNPTEIAKGNQIKTTDKKKISETPIIDG